MEPNHNNNPNLAELPQPKELDGQDLSDRTPAAAPETRAVQPAGGASSSGGQTPLSLSPSIDPPIVTPVPSDTSQAVNSSAATPMADDADLIEKEWVMRAKAIVTHTKDDPYKQNNAMNKVKADYLKKRYNKDLKLNET